MVSIELPSCLISLSAKVHCLSTVLQTVAAGRIHWLLVPRVLVYWLADHIGQKNCAYIRNLAIEYDTFVFLDAAVAERNDPCVETVIRKHAVRDERTYADNDTRQRGSLHEEYPSVYERDIAKSPRCQRSYANRPATTLPVACFTNLLTYVRDPTQPPSRLK